MLRRGLRATSIALLGAGGLTAQQTDTGRVRDSIRTFDPVVVTAARRAERRSNAIISTAVVTRDDIRDAGASDVAAVLTQQLGLQIGAGTPAGSQVLIQGLGDQRVLVLLDGQPMVGRVGGALDLSRLPASIVDRIEIVKGPQSALYGTDAMGGVINIITRRPGGPTRSLASTEAALIAGSHARLDLSARVAGDANAALAYGIDGGRNHVDLAPGVASDAGAFANRWNFRPRLTWRPTSNLAVDLGSLGIVERQRYRTGQLYTFSDNTQLDASIAAPWSRGTTRLTPSFAFSSFEHLSRASSSARPASDSGARDAQKLMTAGLTGSSLVAGMLIDGGAELRHESITADRVPGRRVTGAGALFAQATWIGSWISVAPGLRSAWSERWGTSVTPRLAAIMRPLGDDVPVTARASVAGGFRAPDFKELYLRFVNAAAGYAVAGNDALRPEHSTNVSAELEWAGASVDLRAAAYQNRIRDLIETVGPDAAGAYTYDNVGHATTAGLEVEAAKRWPFADASLGYAYLRARDVESGGPILGRAAHTGRASVRTTPWRVARVTITALYTGAAPSSRDAVGSVSAEREALTQVNVRVARTLSAGGLSRVDLSLGVDDAFDARRGLQWPGFTGRQFSAGLAWPAR